MEEDEKNNYKVPSDEDSDVIARNEVKKFAAKIKMIFFEVPDGGVKEKWPSDSPNYHAVNTERTDIINALVKKPDRENESRQDAQVN